MKEAARLTAVAAESGQLLDETALARTLVRLSHELVERHGSADGLILAGIRTRGVPIAKRLAGLVAQQTGTDPAVVDVDVTDYRDDRPRPSSPGPGVLTAAGVDGAVVVLVDDVIQTGRSIRAGIDAVLAAGRPRSIEVLVLIDRGQREMPLRPTFVGRNIPAASGSRIRVEMLETDGRDGAWLVDGEPRS